MSEDVCGLCAICLEPIVDDSDAYETECKHRFHGKCIAGLIDHIVSARSEEVPEQAQVQPSCPMCRRPLLDPEAESAGMVTRRRTAPTDIDPDPYVPYISTPARFVFDADYAIPVFGTMVPITIYPVNHDIFRISEGMAGLSFAS